MTTLQLQIILHTANLGSISAAAKELGISQPNASSSIKALESEIGFSIFRRDKGGISPTDKGQLFLEHAQRIVNETEIIYNLNEVGSICQLRVGCTSYYRGREAFVKFCANHSDVGVPDLQYYNVSIEDGIGLISKRNLDIVVGVTIDSLLPTLSEMSKNKHITCHVLGDDYPVVTLRKGHPLTQLENFDIVQLENYPYVAYHVLNPDFDAPYFKATFQAPGRYNIYIEEKETRFKIVRDTNAFMLGVKQPEETLQQYNLVEYEYPHYKLKMVCFYRNADAERPEIREFIELLA